MNFLLRATALEHSTFHHGAGGVLLLDFPGGQFLEFGGVSAPPFCLFGSVEAEVIASIMVSMTISYLRGAFSSSGKFFIFFRSL